MLCVRFENQIYHRVLPQSQSFSPSIPEMIMSLLGVIITSRTVLLILPKVVEKIFGGQDVQCVHYKCRDVTSGPPVCWELLPAR